MPEYDTLVFVWSPRKRGQEMHTHGWRAVIEEVRRRSWRAWIAPLVGGEPRVAPAFLPDSTAAKRWCKDALAEHIPLLRQVQDGTLSVPVAAVQQAVCARLQLYTTETATTLFVRTLFCWGEDRERGLRANPEYRQWPIYCFMREVFDWFWSIVRTADAAPARPRLPPGPIALVDSAIDQAATVWAAELAAQPFFPTIVSFSHGVYDWLQSCDLQDQHVPDGITVSPLTWLLHGVAVSLMLE